MYELHVKLQAYTLWYAVGTTGAMRWAELVGLVRDEQSKKSEAHKHSVQHKLSLTPGTNDLRQTCISVPDG